MFSFLILIWKGFKYFLYLSKTDHLKTKLELEILKNWFNENKHHPYANTDKLQELAFKTQLSEMQVHDWINSQRRKLGIKKSKKPCWIFLRSNNILLFPNWITLFLSILCFIFNYLISLIFLNSTGIYELLWFFYKLFFLFYSNCSFNFVY